MRKFVSSPFQRWKEFVLISTAIAGFVTVPTLSAGLTINEIFHGNTGADDYAEFLVMSDMTLQPLDGKLFGDSTFFQTTVNHENTFNAAEIVTGSSYFDSTSDNLRAGSSLVAGGSTLSPDFNYTPTGSKFADSDAWNLTLTFGSGITTTAGQNPFDLGGFGSVVWVDASRPTSGNGANDFISTFSYSWFQGTLGQEIEAREQAGEEGFQVLTPGAECDGILNPKASLSNHSLDGAIDFAGSEGAPVTPGAQNGGGNDDITYDLRAVPEPSTVIPCILITDFGIFLQWQNHFETTSESVT